MPLTLESHKTISCTLLICKLQLIEEMTSAATGNELRFQEAEKIPGGTEPEVEPHRKTDTNVNQGETNNVQNSS